MKKSHLLEKCALVALLVSLTPLGLTACKSKGEPPSKSDQPTQPEQPPKAEHPEHPK